MKINGSAKGKIGERELAEVIRSFGFEARRGQQFTGLNGDPDVVHSIPGLHIECKRVERLNVLAAYKQAAGDAKRGSGLPRIPVVAHRCNRSPWLITLSLNDFLAMVRMDARGLD